MNEYDPFAGLKPGSRLLLAFSGGVDSSVAAKLCRDAGFPILPVYLRLKPGDPPEGPERMRKTAAALGLSPIVLDCSAEFREKVMRRCCDVFVSGRTPNPCALCNPLFKFGKLQDFALANGCSAVATGHYARLERTPEGPVLFRGADPAKDQSYFLFGLSRGQLEKSCFPLGGMKKTGVREIARSLSLPSAGAPESQDVCFVPPGEQAGEYLCRIFDEHPPCGNFVSMAGKILGRHAGIHAFTLGQRKGTGVALGKPAYVHSVDPVKNEIVLTTENGDLLSSCFTVTGIGRLDLPEDERAFHADVQIRYHGRPAPAGIVLTSPGCAEIRFDVPQRAVTPGQAAVFYLGDRQIGGGTIDCIEFCNQPQEE